MTPFAVALAALVGLSLGLLGGGGSILTVPIFVYVLGFGPKQAIAMGLAVVGMVSLFSAGSHWRAGNVAPRPALVFGVTSMVGALAGARLATLVSGQLQMLVFAVVMLLAAGFMLRQRPQRASADPTSGRVPLRRLLPAGFGLGVLTGLVGVGGGFLIVPVLVLLARLPMKQAVGTSLAVIAMNSATGFIGYLGQVEVAWVVILGFTAVAVGGSLVGVRVVRHVPQRALQRGFAVFLLAMGAWVVYQNRGVVLPLHPGRPSSMPGLPAGRVES